MGEAIFECKARESKAPDPQDCDWPFCGCDPYANKVIDAIDESGVYERDYQSAKAVGYAAAVAKLREAAV